MKTLLNARYHSVNCDNFNNFFGSLGFCAPTFLDRLAELKDRVQTAIEETIEEIDADEVIGNISRTVGGKQKLFMETIPRKINLSTELSIFQ